MAAEEQADQGGYEERERECVCVAPGIHDGLKS
jgi:hypothetical protein